MSGFPNRPSRADFGETLENAAPVENPKQDIDAGIFNLTWWQLGGMSRVVPRIVLAWTVESATPDVDEVVYQGVAWDPNAQLATITPVRTGVGVYQITFATSYPDWQGNSIAIALTVGLAGVVGSGGHYAQVVFTSANVAEVRVFDDAGAAADLDATVVAAIW